MVNHNLSPERGAFPDYFPLTAPDITHITVHIKRRHSTLEGFKPAMEILPSLVLGRAAFMHSKHLCYY